ncbi:hypothetical protein CDL15_Pgr009320 [Punica granatum]|uniref:Uncharacterized protein n=1 Tax=Punica granatum TaxID=22663 RepID=A0A218XGL2_PUNGR|nr:hypothetical protein CDL15_Pgr009320 [Punica granatum]PKI76024.1 hypothetical protein CRG98_003574 [Punica granatum]
MSAPFVMTSLNPKDAVKKYRRHMEYNWDDETPSHKVFYLHSELAEPRVLVEEIDNHLDDWLEKCSKNYPSGIDSETFKNDPTSGEPQRWWLSIKEDFVDIFRTVTSGLRPLHSIHKFHGDIKNGVVLRRLV